MSNTASQLVSIKEKGNKAFKKGHFEEAISCYTAAFELLKNQQQKTKRSDYDDLDLVDDENNNNNNNNNNIAPVVEDDSHIYLSNRSAAFLKINKPDRALEDASACIELKPSWAKGYYRKGMALLSMHKFQNAMETFQQGLKLEPNNAELAKALNDAKSKLLLQQQQQQQQKSISITTTTTTANNNNNSGATAYAAEMASAGRLVFLADSLTEGTDVAVRTIDATKGRGVVALRDFQEGEVIFMETPFVSARTPSKRNIPKTCDHCLRFLGTTSPSLPCAQAKRKKHNKKTIAVDTDEDDELEPSIYCSEECRSAAWDEYHRLLCCCGGGSGSNSKVAAVAKLRKYCCEQGNMFPWMVAKIYARMIQDIDANEGEVDAEAAYDPIRVLYKVGPNEVPDVGEFQRVAETEFALIKAALYDPRVEQFFTVGRYMQFLSAIKLNAIGINPYIHETTTTKKKKDFLVFPECGGLLLLGSLLNHSCEPNVYCDCCMGDHEVSFVARRDICAGEELNISYVPATTTASGYQITRERRRELLLKGYWFDCQCTKCRRGE